MDSAPLTIESLLRILGQASDAVCVVHALSGRITWASVGVAQLADCNPRDLIGRHYYRLETELGGPTAWTKALEDMRRWGRVRRDAGYVHSSGGTLPVEISSELTTVDGVEYALIVAREIGERKRLEQALWEGTAQLRKLVKQREGELQKIWTALRPDGTNDDLFASSGRDVSVPEPPAPDHRQAAVSSKTLETSPVWATNLLDPAPRRAVAPPTATRSDQILPVGPGSRAAGDSGFK